jgi:O-acetylserine/cysteine efflux transporter
LPISHLLLALAVVAVWGSNFVVIKVGLGEIPPLLFATLRFVLSSLPLLLFVRRPAVAWRHLIGYGLFMGLQFALLFLAMRQDLSPGLASLLLQSQVFMTLLLVALVQHERMRLPQLAALAIAILGFMLIAWQSVDSSHADVTRLGHVDVSPFGLLLALGAALAWACANLISRSIGKVDMLGFMVWSSLFAVPPLLLCTLWFEGPARIAATLPNISLTAWGAVLWQAAGNTLFGFGAWGWLLARHPAATITPLALLVPIFGMGTSSLLLGEALQNWKLAATALVIGGLALNVLASRWPRKG